MTNLSDDPNFRDSVKKAVKESNKKQREMMTNTLEERGVDINQMTTTTATMQESED